ncbi:glycosyltransferase family 2 protein [Dialister succinatiphilus]|uniref:glycosyltransferase family 2 protein n=1 Tax=Dialister succinatiphilus TaxID=487173 RepID=UPI004029E382
MELLSIVVPCFNEEATIPIFYETVEKIKKQIPAEVEYCFIDDGSRDRTLPILRELNKKSGGYVHYRSFSRNFGKEAALYAGLKMAKGDYIVTMDVDLQDPPSLLPEMWKILHDPESDYDCVATRRTTRKGEPPIRSFFARLFYRLINELSDTEIVDGARDYRMMTRQMVDAVIHDSEYNRFSKGIFSWVGFHTKWLAYENVERSAGETKLSFWKLFKYSIEGILAYTTVPLYLSSIMGIIMCGVSFLALMFILIRAMIYGDPVAGWPSLVCIITLLGGLVLLALGIMGLYIAKIYLETKKRQIFIVREEA